MNLDNMSVATETADVYCLDTRMFDVDSYGSVYIIDREPALVVDTGTGQNIDRLYAALSQLGVERDDEIAVLLTHVHLDHAGGAGRLLQQYPEACVYVHEQGYEHLVTPETLVAGTKAAVGDQWRYYTPPISIDPARLRVLPVGESVQIGESTIELIAAPGHAPHQIMFYDVATDILFTGDAFGIYIPSQDNIRETTPPAQFDLERNLTDVRCIETIEPTRVCFGHFGSTTFVHTQAESYRRQLIEWVEAVRQQRAAQADDEAVIQHFVSTIDSPYTWTAERDRAEARINTKGVLGYLDRKQSPN
ncbi:MAG: Zn-dependent hydrolase [Haloquadratum sp. J07HQX50]|jgi:Zn-dependent hydrolases, including glyoxylases|nr:MAG: Zn-dependent hydrolase [Haloquadratum sp. J07HQX50]